MQLDHTKCRVSTGIDGGLSAGQGKLDACGYFEIPCEPCRVIAQASWDATEQALIANGERFLDQMAR